MIRNLFLAALVAYLFAAIFLEFIDHALPPSPAERAGLIAGPAGKEQTK
jgi:hypothetical protein